MSNLLYLSIPLLTGIICWIFGFYIGKWKAQPGDGSTESTLRSDLAACKANASNLSDKVAQLEHELYLQKTAEPSREEKLSNAAAVVDNALKDIPVVDHEPSAGSFDAQRAKEILGKKIVENDLMAIEGIGPKIAEIFHNQQIFTWYDLANSSVEECNRILAEAGERFKMHNPSSWPQQAKLLAEGNFEEFKSWTENLIGGKR